MGSTCNSRFICDQYFETCRGTLRNIQKHCEHIILVQMFIHTYVYEMAFYIEIGHFLQESRQYQKWVTLCILQTTCGIIQGGLNVFEIKMIKIQIMKGLLKIYNPIISIVDRYKMWAIASWQPLIQGLKFMILVVVFSMTRDWELEDFEFIRGCQILRFIIFFWYPYRTFFVLVHKLLQSRCCIFQQTII